MSDREAPTKTALAVKDLLACIDNPAYRRVIETRAVLGGWVGARGAGVLVMVSQSDAVAIGAIEAVWDLLRSWAAECDEAPAATVPGLRALSDTPPGEQR